MPRPLTTRNHHASRHRQVGEFDLATGGGVWGGRRGAKWRRPQDIKDQFASASICGNNRVVFNVGGNKYRLVVEVQYQAGIVWVKFVGTHVQYDRIDVETVNDY